MGGTAVVCCGIAASLLLSIFRYSLLRQVTVILLLVGVRATVFVPDVIYVNEFCHGVVIKEYERGVQVKITRCGERQVTSRLYVSCFGVCPPMYAPQVVKVTSVSGFGVFSGKGERVYTQEKIPLPIYYQILNQGHQVRLLHYAWLSTRLQPKQSGLLTSMLFGEVEIPTDLQKMMKELGMLHIVAISGINIVYLQRILQHITGKLRRKFRNLIEIGTLLALFVVVGEAVSLYRAIVMVLFNIVAQSAGIKLGKGYFVSALTVLLLLFPEYLLDAGFWLVSAASVGVYSVAPTITKVWKNKVMREVIGSIVIWLCVVPVTWLLFGEVRPIGVLVGLCVSILIEWASILGYLSVFVRPIPIVSDLILIVLGVISALILYVVNMFHGLVGLYD